MTTPRKPAVADPRVDDDFTPLAKACSAMGTISKSMARASGEPGPPALVGLECGPNPCTGSAKVIEVVPEKPHAIIFKEIRQNRVHSQSDISRSRPARTLHRRLAIRLRRYRSNTSTEYALGLPGGGRGASTHDTVKHRSQPPPRATHIDSSAPANPAITPLAASLLNSFL